MYRFASAQGDGLPAIYLSNGAFLQYTTNFSISSFSMLTFLDFTYLNGNQADTRKALLSLEYLSTNKSTSLFKNYNSITQPLALVNYGGSNLNALNSGSMEGRLCVGFTVAPSDRRIYIGQGGLYQSIGNLSSVDSYPSNSRWLLGSAQNGAYSVPANEFFELFVYNQSLSDSEMTTLVKNITYSFDRQGSMPLIPAKAAYSLRKLVQNYTGPQLQVKRASDSQIADLYLDV